MCKECSQDVSMEKAAEAEVEVEVRNEKPASASCQVEPKTAVAF